MANNFLPFCPTDTGTNLLSQSDYAAAADRTSGNKPGIASAKLNNKAIRQATYVASQIAQFISDRTHTDTLDDNLPAKLLSQVRAALQSFAPVGTSYLSGTGTHNLTYVFAIASGSATSGATYTNNGITYTVTSTIVSDFFLNATGGGVPTNSGTLTKTGGTGDSSITFYAVRAPLYMRVRMAGAGAGGQGSGTSPGTPGTGGNSTFGTTLLVANGGAPTVAGTASLGSGPTGLALTGGGRSGNAVVSSANPGAAGGTAGGANALGGAGIGGEGGAGGAGATNTGAGGGGGGTNGTASLPSGHGGCSGGYVDAMFTDTVLTVSTWAYAVGAAGAAGTAGSGASAFGGGAGGSGVILVTEYYQ